MNSIANNATHAPLSLNHTFDASHSSSLTQMQGNIALARVLLHIGKPVAQWMGHATTQGIQLAKASAVQLDQLLQGFNLPTAKAETLRGHHRLLQTLTTQPTSQGLGSTITDCQFNSAAESTVGLGSTLTQSTFLGNTDIGSGTQVANAHFDQSVEIGSSCNLSQVTCRAAALFGTASQASQSHFEGEVDLALNTDVKNITAQGRFTADAGSIVAIDGKGIIFNGDTHIKLATQMTDIPSHWLGLYAREENNNYIFDQGVTISQDESGNLEIEVEGSGSTSSPTKLPTPTASPVSMNTPPTYSPTGSPKTLSPTLSTTPAPTSATTSITKPPAPIATNSTPPTADGDKPNRPDRNSAASAASPSLMTTLAVASATMILTHQLTRN